jgi:hypothetical protein
MQGNSVRGLGVCDVLELELTLEQIDGLDERIAALGDAGSDEQRRLARLLCDRLPQAPPYWLAGPAGMIGELVRASLCDAVERLAAVAADPPRDPAGCAELDCAGVAVSAWLRTYLECRRVEAFSFEPGLDPEAPW